MRNKLKLIGVGIASIIIVLFVFQSSTSAERPSTHQEQFNQLIEHAKIALQKSEDSNSVVMEVNDRKITKKEFERTQAFSKGKSKEEVTDQLIRHFVLIDIAKEQGVQVSENEVQEHIEYLKKSFNRAEAIENFTKHYETLGYNNQSEFWECELVVQTYSENLYISKFLDVMREDIMFKNKNIESYTVEELVAKEVAKLIEEKMKDVKVKNSINFEKGSDNL